MKTISRLILALCLCSMSVISFGQAADQPCDGDDPFDCPEIPLDTEAYLLLLGGGAAGVYTMIKKRLRTA